MALSVTPTDEMKTLTVGEKIYEVVDDQAREDISEVKADLTQRFDDIVSFFGDIKPYLYKENTYINAGVETALSGYDLYKFPVSKGDLFNIQQTDATETFYGQINAANAVWLIKNGSYEVLSANGAASNHPNYYFLANQTPITRNFLMVFVEDNISHIMVSVKRGNEKKAAFTINTKGTNIIGDDLLRRSNTAYHITVDNSMVGNAYKTVNNGIAQIFTSGYSVRTIALSTGDKIHISAKATAINYWAYFTDKYTLETNATTQDFTAPSDGFLQTFWYSDDNNTVIVYPKNSIDVDWSQLINIPDTASAFNGLSAVAFGTSLTYRALTTYGYLQYLPDLCGMSFDNQGIGSSTILGNMLTAIKNYTGYAGKRVAILEGFVNDWYTNKDLGTYEDTGETTVCGCVRSAINYMLSQNANLTIFLVLDPYGRNYGGVNCATTATNGAGLTQKEYYDEIAKVAESLGIPVIKEYVISQISENTPQYIVDNIHPTALGAKQSAYVIWSQMRQHFPNQV